MLKIVQAEVIKIPVKEGIVGDLVKSLGAGVLQAVVEAEVIAEQAVLGQQLVLQARPGISLGPAEVEGVFDMPFHKAQVDEDVIEKQKKRQIGRG